MATLTDRLPDNTPGRYYVDSSCIDCDQCRAIAPRFFARDEEQSHQGQLHRLIRMWVDVPRQFTAMARSGANPISPADVLEAIRARAFRGFSSSQRQPDDRLYSI